MSNQLNLSIVSPDKVLFEGPIQYLSVPGGAGYMGILVDHMPLISSLTAGQFEVRPASGEVIHFVTKHPGFLEIAKNQVSVLLDAIDSNAISAAQK